MITACHVLAARTFTISINQSIIIFILHHSTEAHATVRLCRIKEKCLKTDRKCVNGWSSSTVQWFALYSHQTGIMASQLLIIFFCSSVCIIFYSYIKFLCSILRIESVAKRLSFTEL